MIKNLAPLDRGIRLFAAVLFGWLASAAFIHPIARIFFLLVAIGALYEAVAAACPLYAMLGVKKPGQKMSEANLALLGLLGSQLTLAYLWWNAGWEKINGSFGAGLEETLDLFASENTYEFYRELILNYGIPNAAMLANVVMWGQLAIGLALFVSVLMFLSDDRRMRMTGLMLAILGLAGGVFMNANFWLAAGWTGPAIATANIAMFWPSLILLTIWKIRFRESLKK